MRFTSFEELIHYYVIHTPDAVALYYGTGLEKIRVTYKEWEKEILSRSETLRRSRKTCVGVLCDGSYDCVTEIFAAVRAGMQVVLLDDNAETEQIRHTDVDVLWGDEELTEELLDGLTNGVQDSRGKILFFTSGTTDKNKAVVLTEKSLCASAYNGGSLLPLRPEDILLCMLPLNHVFGFVCGLLWGLSCGAAVALGRGPRHYMDDCSYFRPSAVSAVPLLIGFLLEKKLLNKEMKLVLIGAGDCPSGIPMLLKQMGIRVSFGYGLTETSSGVALSLEEDPYAMTVCPDDEITFAEDKEILIHAPTCIMEGYYKDEAATNKVLCDGILSTGDLGELDENGKLHIIGRKKEVLVLNDGTKIFLPEYEKELTAALAGKEFAVIVRDGCPALVVSGKEEDREQVQSAIAPFMKTLPFGRQIKKIIFLQKAFPRTATGKIKRWILEEKVKQVSGTE